MESLRRRSKVELSWRREFSESRLEGQILRQAFELVIPVLVPEAKESEPSNNLADRMPVRATQSQGASQS
jgi:hypothetical protein